MQAATPFRFRRELPPGALGVAMNLPTLLTLGLVLAYPIYYAAYLSFHKVSLAELRRGVFPFVGLANYQRIFNKAQDMPAEDAKGQPFFTPELEALLRRNK